MVIRKYFALSLVAASLAMAGCSSDDDDDGGTTGDTAGTSTAGTTTTGTTTTGTTTTGTTTTGTTTTGMTTSGDEDVEDESTMEGSSILDVARGTSDGTLTPVADLSELVTLLGNYPVLLNLLDDESEGAPMYTVFAPNNAALMALDTTGLSDDDILNTLQYHVVEGEPMDFSAEGVEFPVTLTTVQGGTLTIREEEETDDTDDPDDDDETEDSLEVVDQAGNAFDLGEPVTAPSNGTVYIIEGVLAAPPAPTTTGGGETAGTATAGGTDGDTGGGTGGGAAGSAYAAIQADEDLDEFEAIVDQAQRGLSLEDPNNNGTIVLAPTDDALDDGLSFATQEEADAFYQGYAVVVGGTENPRLEPGTTVQTVGPQARTGLAVEAGADADSVTVGGVEATLLIEGTGGTVYKLDGLLP